MSTKPLTKFQTELHVYLTGALGASPVVGAWLTVHLYSVGWLSLHALICGFLVPTVVLLFWLDTEVQWRKREAMARKVLARITNNV